MTPVRVIFSLMLCGILSGCGSAIYEPNDDPLPNFKALITASLESGLDTSQPHQQADQKHAKASAGQPILPAGAHIDDVALSDMNRKVLTNLHGWAWQTCLRATVGDVKRTFAIFVAQNHIVDVRGAVAVDQCDQGQYSPLNIERPESGQKPKTESTKDNT